MQSNHDRINIFIAYSRKDKVFLEELQKYITPLKRYYKLNIWYDGKIQPGTTWEEEIKNRIHKSHIIIFLVSADSLSSDYFYEKELMDALKRHEKNEATIVPIILRSCLWHLSTFAALQVLPTEGIPISSDFWNDKADAYTNVVKGIEKLIKSRQQIIPKEEIKKTNIASSSLGNRSSNNRNPKTDKIQITIPSQGHLNNQLNIKPSPPALNQKVKTKNRPGLNDDKFFYSVLIILIAIIILLVLISLK